MLTGHGERSRVVEGVKVGVNELLLKPVSSKALQDRVIAVLTKPRQIMQNGGYYGPTPRKLATAALAENDREIARLTAMN
jgi:two-component system, chemotaxis family, chemotaxis protein CheY